MLTKLVRIVLKFNGHQKFILEIITLTFAEPKKHIRHLGMTLGICLSRLYDLLLCYFKHLQHLSVQKHRLFAAFQIKSSSTENPISAVMFIVVRTWFINIAKKEPLDYS
jgi:hypothetical protein